MRKLVRRLRLRGDDGLVTLEWALVIMLAVLMAGAMTKVVSSAGVAAALNGMVMRALR